MLNPSDHPPKPQERLQFFRELLYQYPLAFWGALWFVLIIMSGVAVIGLLNPGPLEPEASVPSPTLSTIQESVAKPEPSVSKPESASTFIAEPKTVRESPSKKDLPLSLFGGIALGCAVGSLLITQALKSPSQPRQASKRAKPGTTSRKKRRQPPQSSRPVSRTVQLVNPQPNFQTQPNQQPAINNVFTPVTVLPPEASHPLDGGGENLADLLDLRKRQSLASIIRGK
ncbi:MAG TPA: hypothetical protein V6D33_00255 [Cyanophyceae cyanobacterium]